MSRACSQRPILQVGLAQVYLRSQPPTGYVKVGDRQNSTGGKLGSVIGIVAGLLQLEFGGSNPNGSPLDSCAHVVI